MTPREQKKIAKRLERSNKKLWHTLDGVEKQRAIFAYDALLSEEQLSPLQVITESWKKYDEVLLVLVGLSLGIIGNLVANLLDRYFVSYGIAYTFVVVILFLVVIFGFDRLADKSVTLGYKRGKLLEKILEKREMSVHRCCAARRVRRYKRSGR